MEIENRFFKLRRQLKEFSNKFYESVKISKIDKAQNGENESVKLDIKEWKEETTKSGEN